MADGTAPKDLTARLFGGDDAVDTSPKVADDPTPSKADIAMTREVAKAAETLGELSPGSIKSQTDGRPITAGDEN